MNATYTVHSANKVPVQLPATLADGTAVTATVQGAVYELIAEDAPTVTLSVPFAPGEDLEFAAGDTVLATFTKQSAVAAVPAAPAS